MKKYQFTLFAEKYKPVSTIVEANSRMDFAKKGKPYITAMQNICAKRLWTLEDLKRFGYNSWKVREVGADE